jgi:2-polyprenyl-3-methyl-5-hydroxy-6-metoxy-1,4-benzoquinol methylase
LDDVAKYNIDRWRALVSADAIFCQPAFRLDKHSARNRLDPEGRLGDVAGQQVLCLAGGGGQQSIAFALMGAIVTVADLSQEQLQKDAETAAQYKLNLNLLQSDMRDLSILGESSFDIVWHPYSINFVPEVRAVFGQVARVLKTGGVYRFNCANPAFMGVRGADWNGRGYVLGLSGVALTLANRFKIPRREHQIIKELTPAQDSRSAKSN